ncbi:MAG: hypothetical protein HQL37_10405 [Alphaproteobacteria bacterium]|nr:hypothetical protein [Alphaproteobacteria bacterium]
MQNWLKTRRGSDSRGEGRRCIGDTLDLTVCRQHVAAYHPDRGTHGKLPRRSARECGEIAGQAQCGQLALCDEAGGQGDLDPGDHLGDFDQAEADGAELGVVCQNEPLAPDRPGRASANSRWC